MIVQVPLLSVEAFEEMDIPTVDPVTGTQPAANPTQAPYATIILCAAAAISA
jgi:hypothetical protein